MTCFNIWKCDRCASAIERERDVVVLAHSGSPRAVRNPQDETHPEGWEEYANDETVIDVCPNCLTDEERADSVLREVEADVYFGEEMV